MDNSLPAQARVIAHVAARSEGGPIDPALRVTLNFHPDRRVGEVPILQAMALDGLYRSQFETGTSNGGLTAHPGGDRWSCESRLFGTAYDEVPASERPKYGSLNFRRQGPSHRWLASVRIRPPAPQTRDPGPHNALLPRQCLRANPFRRRPADVTGWAGRGR